jgi:sterol desaturase/sphingolipid hydroxylase (fatty acid hydroxylase superfamily)
MQLSRVSYFADFVLCPILAAGLVAAALVHGGLPNVGPVLLAVVAGVIGWTLVEYAIHRSIYHRVQPFQGYHDAHHDDPKALIGAPSVIGIVIIFAVVFLPLLPLGLPVACGGVSGFILGYFAYMMVHHASHHWDIRPGTHLYALRRHHARHHYAHDLGNFGVSTSFWDHVFGTALERPRRGEEPAAKH